MTADVKRKVRLGVTLEDATKENAAALGLKDARGAIIRQIDFRGSAGKTNLMQGDVIVELDGKPVADTADVIVAISEKSPGDPVTLTVFRHGKTYKQPVTLAKRQDREAPAAQATLPSVRISRIAVNLPSVPAGGPRRRHRLLGKGSRNAAQADRRAADNRDPPGRQGPLHPQADRGERRKRREHAADGAPGRCEKGRELHRAGDGEIRYCLDDRNGLLHDSVTCSSVCEKIRR